MGRAAWGDQRRGGDGTRTEAGLAVAAGDVAVVLADGGLRRDRAPRLEGERVRHGPAPRLLIGVDRVARLLAPARGGVRAAGLRWCTPHAARPRVPHPSPPAPRRPLRPSGRQRARMWNAQRSRRHRSGAQAASGRGIGKWRRTGIVIAEWALATPARAREAAMRIIAKRRKPWSAVLGETSKTAGAAQSGG